MWGQSVSIYRATDGRENTGKKRRADAVGTNLRPDRLRSGLT